METNETKIFLEAIWGDSAGTRFVCTGNNFKGKTFKTNEDAVAFAITSSEEGLEVYYAPHLFKSDVSRKAENSIGCSALYLDVDCKGKGGYTSKRQALQSLIDFTKETCLPEPGAIDSGTGLHFYWLFRQMMDPLEWDRTAGRLKALCKDLGLKADANVTADKARVMRVPGSTNKNKNDPERPQPCKVLKMAEPCDFAEFSMSLDRNTPVTFTAEQCGQNDRFLAGLESYPPNPERSRKLVELCLQALRLDRCDDHDTWMGVGFILWNTFKGDGEGLRIWDDWSRKSNRYKIGECERRWETVSERSEGDRKTLGSLITWAREDGGEDFESQYAQLLSRQQAERIEKRYQLTDAGNARRLVDANGDNIRFDRDRKLWFVNNGKFWIKDAWADVQELAKRTIEAMRSEVVQTNWTGDDAQKKREDAIKAVNRFDMLPRLEGMVRVASSTPSISVSSEDFNSNPNLLNVNNGVLNLRTGKLESDRSSDLFTYCLDVEYDPGAKDARWERFLIDVTKGDRALISYLQRAIGYTLTGNTSEEKFFLCLGTGGNGKGTLIESIMQLLGPLSTPIRTSALMRHKLSSHSGHSDDIASLDGKRLISMSEAGRGRRLDVEILKQITGGDRIRASQKHKASFDFKVQGKLWMQANDKPEMDESDEGVQRRTVVIPFTRTITKEDRDDTLKPYLQSTMAQPAILAWAVAGAIEWYKRGLGTCDTVASATAAYLMEQDIAANFIYECCDRDESFVVSPMDMYTEFKWFCESIGIPPWPVKHLNTELRRLGFEQSRSKSSRFWRGFKISSKEGRFLSGLPPIAAAAR